MTVYASVTKLAPASMTESFTWTVWILPPGRWDRSSTTASMPPLRNRQAAASPLMPAPITITRGISASLRGCDPSTIVGPRRRFAGSAGQVVEKLQIVVEVRVWPGRSSALGKSGRFGASGKPCVSIAMPPYSWYPTSSRPRPS